MTLTGLRLSEAVLVEWDSTTAPITILTGADQYLIQFREQKSGRQSVLPIMPDAQEFFDRRFPRDRRSGRVFDVRHTPRHVGRILSRIGQISGVVVSDQSRRGGVRKTASAHDLRRTCAARWAELLPESVLAAIMRHQDPKTTRQYYAILDAERLARTIRERLAEAAAGRSRGK